MLCYHCSATDFQGQTHLVFGEKGKRKKTGEKRKGIYMTTAGKKYFKDTVKTTKNQLAKEGETP